MHEYLPSDPRDIIRQSPSLHAKTRRLRPASKELRSRSDQVAQLRRQAHSYHDDDNWNATVDASYRHVVYGHPYPPIAEDLPPAARRRLLSEVQHRIGRDGMEVIEPEQFTRFYELGLIAINPPNDQNQSEA